MLPYSYATHGLHETSGTPTFTMSAYTADDTKQPIAASVAALDAEVGSVRTVWPTTPIVLVGHSYGGLVAEEWWEQAWATGDHQGVAHHRIPSSGANRRPRQPRPPVPDTGSSHNASESLCREGSTPPATLTTIQARKGRLAPAARGRK